jgi:fumarylacetoacetate (FAA) hydrolase
MYQGGSDAFLGPREPIRMASEDAGIDFEAEVAAVVGDVPVGASREVAGSAVRLLMLVNDVSLRNLIPAELGKGFGFFQSKPSSAFSPVAVTPDELEGAWNGERLSLPLLVSLNDRPFGRADAGVDMTLRLPDARRPRGEDAALVGGHDQRLRHRVEQGRRRRPGLPIAEGASATPASPSSGRWRRSSTAPRRRRSSPSATRCASR